MNSKDTESFSYLEKIKRVVNAPPFIPKAKRTLPPLEEEKIMPCQLNIKAKPFIPMNTKDHKEHYPANYPNTSHHFISPTYSRPNEEQNPFTEISAIEPVRNYDQQYIANNINIENYDANTVQTELLIQFKI